MNYSKEITQKFLEKYKKLEEIEKRSSNRYEYIRHYYSNKLDTFRYLRNLLAHNTTEEFEFPAIVADSILNDLENILNEVNEKVYFKMIPFHKLYTAKMSSSLIDILNEMYTKNFSYIPVLDENDIIIGVFTENCILSYIAKNEIGILYDNKTLLEEFKEFIPLAKNQNEEFLFFSRNEYYYKVKESFNNVYKDGKRLSAVFITEAGKSNEKILGMITAWDILRG